MLLLLVACAKGAAPQPVLPTVELTVGGTTVVAEVADDPAEREHGLMQREKLGTDAGMVFVYPREGQRSFWMKNTIIPLSIAYIDSVGRIVRIADMQPLDETPVMSYRPAMYALEMEQGWFVAHGISAGDKVDGLPAPSQQ